MTTQWDFLPAHQLLWIEKGAYPFPLHLFGWYASTTRFEKMRCSPAAELDFPPSRS